MMSPNWKEAVKEGLKKERISATKLADRADLSNSTIHDILQNPIFQPQIGTLIKVFIALRISMSFSHADDMSLERLLHDILQKKWSGQVNADQLGQLWDLAKGPGGKAVATRLLEQELYPKFSQTLAALSIAD